MKPRDLPMALVAFLGLVVTVPMVQQFVSGAGLPAQDAFLAGLVLPAALLLYASSWVSPGLSRPVLGAFLLAAFMVMAPWFWQASGLAADRLADGSLAQLGIRLALPVVVLAFVGTLGYKRLTIAR